MKTAEPFLIAASPLLKTVEKCIEDLLVLEGVATDTCHELKEKLATHAFNLVVVGQFKRGKTSLINALVGSCLLPVGVVPLTSIITIVSYGNAVTMEVVYHNGAREHITAERLVEYVTEKGNPGNTKGVQEVLISYPSTWLKGGTRIIDTPGVGSVYDHNTDVARRFLPKADAVLFVLSAEQPVSEAEREFLREVREHAGKIFFVLNKADLLAEHELQEALDFVQQTLAATMGHAVRLFPVSARRALEGKQKGSPEMIRESRLPEFFDALDRFLLEEKGRVFIASVARSLLRVVSQARLNNELEIKSLATPLNELKEKIAAFEQKKNEVILAKKEYALLLDGGVRDLLKNVVETDLEAFRARLARRIKDSVEQHFNQNRKLPSGKLRETLEQHVIVEVRSAFDRWRAAEDEKVGAAFRELCETFASRIDGIVDELCRFSSQLFAVPFDAIQAESVWRRESEFYYKFWSEPPSLKILTSSAILALPKVIGDRLLLRQAQRFGEESVDTQSGRVRYDFAQRLERSARDFKVVILDRIDATIDGIERAVTKGTSMRAIGAADFEQRNKTLSAMARSLDDIRERLHSVMANVNA